MKKNRKYLRIFALYIFFLCYLPTWGNRPNVVNIEPKIYGGANKNWSIAYDENGMIYVGNNKGLLEFDGVSWNLNLLPSKGIVRSVEVAANHEVFTGGTEEFGVWKRAPSGKLQYRSLSSNINFKDIQNSDFWRIFATPKGVYFQSFSTIFFYDYKTVRKLTSLAIPILLLNQVREKLLYQQMKGEIYFLQDNKSVRFPGSEIFRNTDVRVILPYGNTGYLFASNSKGLIVYENGKYHDLNPTLSAILNQKDVNAGVLSPRGTYLFGTLLDGMYEVDAKGTILNHFSSENVLQNNSVLSIRQDNNNVWIGLDKGISYVSFIDDMSYYINSIDNVGAIYAACFWKNYLLIGTNQGVFAIHRSELNGYSSLMNQHLIKGTEGQVWNLKEIDGNLYCCHNNGLYIIDENLSVKKFYDIGTGVYNIYKEQYENSDYLFISTYHSLLLYDSKNQKMLHPKGINEPIYDSQIDHLGNLWLEHPSRGIYRCQWQANDAAFKSIHYYGGENSQPSLPSRLKLFRAGGRINMMGDNTAYFYNDIADKIEPNKTLNALFSSLDPVRKVFACSKNRYIALCDNTFHLFSYDGYKAFILKSYNIGHNMSFVDNYETIIPLNDSINLLALDDGFILYQIPKKIEFISKKPKVEAPIIISFKSINREKLSEFKDFTQGTIKLKNGFNSIEIYFTTKKTFSDNITSQYILENVDINWSSKSHINKASYERLPAGNYTFKVRAVDISGNRSKTTTLHFTISPPWYNSIWAYLIYSVVIIAALYMTRLFILYRYKKKHIRNIRRLETMRLQMLTDELQNQVNQKNAELVTQTSFIIHKNELIEEIKALIDDFYAKNKSSVLQQLTYKINSLLNNNLDTEEDWKSFLIKFEEKHTGFFKKLKTEYPDLTSSDLRLCACLKLNMGTKDIASLMNLSVRAIENNRYRLRKKLNLKTEENLNDFFISLD